MSSRTGSGDVVATFRRSVKRARIARGARLASAQRPVVVMRTNPKDSSLGRLVDVITSRFPVEVLVWDRERDFVAPWAPSHARVHRLRLRAGYYDTSALIGVALLQPWFVVRGLRARPAVVHAMDLDAGWAGWVVARLRGVPFVYQCLDPYYAALPSSWPKVLGRLARNAEERLIMSSDLFVITDKRRLQQHPNAHPTNVIEFVNAPLFEIPAGLRRLPGPEGSLQVGYIGSLVPHRNLEILVQTVGEMAEEGFRLVMGGYGPLESEISALCAAYDNVDFLGWVADAEMTEIQSTFDIFVQVEDPDHPAYRWVSPNKLFDSMAFGRPIVVAERTLAAETVREIGHGIEVRYGDGAALAAALRSLKADPEKCRKMGQAGLDAFGERWAPRRQRENMVSGYISLLDATDEVTDHAP